MFGYLDPIDAATARGLIERAIVDAVLITGAGRPMAMLRSKLQSWDRSVELLIRFAQRLSSIGMRRW